MSEPDFESEVEAVVRATVYMFEKKVREAGFLQDPVKLRVWLREKAESVGDISATTSHVFRPVLIRLGASPEVLGILSEFEKL